MTLYPVRSYYVYIGLTLFLGWGCTASHGWTTTKDGKRVPKLRAGLAKCITAWAKQHVFVTKANVKKKLYDVRYNLQTCQTMVLKDLTDTHIAIIVIITLECRNLTWGEYHDIINVLSSS